jgi:hypothetical protein
LWVMSDDDISRWSKAFSLLSGVTDYLQYNALRSFLLPVADLESICFHYFMTLTNKRLHPLIKHATFMPCLLVETRTIPLYVR